MLSLQSLSDALENGREWTSWFHKTGGPSSVGVTRWADFSMGAGTPKYNAYVGAQLQFTPMQGLGNEGIYLGPDQPGYLRHLVTAQIMTGQTTLAPATFMLLDYLGFYPLIDGDSTDQQDMVNAVPLPRHSGGQVMLVCTTPTAVDVSGTMSYTNDQGVSGRSATFALQFSTFVGCILSAHTTANAAKAPFLPLAAGDTGVRSIQSITLNGAAGGFFAAVIVKPVLTVPMREAITVEVQPIVQKAQYPIIQDGAYLNWIYLVGGSGVATPFRGNLQFAWC